MALPFEAGNPMSTPYGVSPDQLAQLFQLLGYAGLNQQLVGDDKNPGMITQAFGRLGDVGTQFHSAAQAAQGSANQAAETYRGAANAPIPQPGPGSAIQNLMGNIGTAISRNPEFAQQGREKVNQERQSLMEARAQKLQGLHDEYLQKAEVARQMGQADLSLKYETAANQAMATLNQYFSNVGRMQELGSKLVESGNTNLAELAKTALQGQTALGVAGKYATAMGARTVGDMFGNMLQNKEIDANTYNMVMRMVGQQAWNTPLGQGGIRADMTAGGGGGGPNLTPVPLTQEQLATNRTEYNSNLRKAIAGWKQGGGLTEIQEAALADPRGRGYKDTPADFHRWLDEVKGKRGTPLHEFFRIQVGQDKLFDPNSARDAASLQSAAEAFFPESFAAELKGKAKK